MVEIIINDEKLTLALSEIGAYYVKPLEFPREHIKAARVDTKGVAREWHRRLMSFADKIPNIIRTGVYYEDGSNVFWGIDDPDRVIEISMENERYQNLFVEVKNPQQAVAAIEAVLNGEKTHSEEVADGLVEN